MAKKKKTVNRLTASEQHELALYLYRGGREDARAASRDLGFNVTDGNIRGAKNLDIQHKMEIQISEGRIVILSPTPEVIQLLIEESINAV